MRLVRLCRTLLLLVAVSFVLSAWLYCLATLHSRPETGGGPQDGENSVLIQLFREHGTVILVAELAALALCGALWVVGERKLASRVDATRRAGAAHVENEPQDTTASNEHDHRENTVL
jgi:hypothetical protein